MTRHLVAIGGGFSGAMFAVQAVRAGGRATIVERRGAAGLGLAYGAAHDSHLLNVRAANMSALPEEPDHFAAWLDRQGWTRAGASFAPRRLYGTYVQSLVDEAVASGALQIVADDAVDVLIEPASVTVHLAGGDRIAADAVALAVGNLPPHPPLCIDAVAFAAGVFWSDPWQPGVASGLADDQDVVVIGTGLTMIDVALLLDLAGFKGRILALSRRGLLPRPHAAGPPSADRRSAAPDPAAAALVHDVRRRADAVGWRHAVDELRPFTQGLWRSASLDERRRFLRHLRPWWDVHRHRLAPALHDRIQATIDRGQLEVIAAKLCSVAPTPAGATITFRRRGAAASETATAARIINCTGPEGNLASTSEPLLRRLLDRGTIRPDPLGIGIDVDTDARVIGTDGAPDRRLAALGPLTRGCLWEISAAPDIRVQVRDVARRLVSEDPSPRT